MKQFVVRTTVTYIEPMGDETTEKSESSPVDDWQKAEQLLRNLAYAHLAYESENNNNFDICQMKNDAFIVDNCYDDGEHKLFQLTIHTF